MESSITLIHYYLYKGWIGHVQQLCESILEKQGNDVIILFWRAFGIILEGSFSSAVRELDSLKRKKEVELPCLHALVYAHSRCKNIDHEEVAHLELQIVMAEENAGELSLYLCARFFWYLREYQKAYKFIGQLLSCSEDASIRARVLILRGWIEATKEIKSRNDVEVRKNAMATFSKIGDNKNVDYLLGIAKYHELHKDYEKAVEFLDRIIVQFPTFKYSISEKALILLKMGSWEACFDTVERALQNNAVDIEALRILLMYQLTREGKARDAAKNLRGLSGILGKLEPNNSDILYQTAKSVARIADRNEEVLKCTLAMIDSAILSQTNSGMFYAEKGYQLSLLANYQLSMDAYKKALTYEESNEMALHGMIYCQIKLGEVEDAYQQMEFLNIIQESVGTNASFTFLQALLSWYKDRNRSKHSYLLQESVRLHMEDFKKHMQSGDASTSELLCALNPSFLVELAAECMDGEIFENTGRKLDKDSENSSSALANGMSILEKLVRNSPGLLHAQLLLAQAYFGCDRLDDAYQICSTMLSLEPNFSEAHLMIARIFLERDNHRSASSSLEQALSHDFAVRHTVPYHTIKAKIAESTGDIENSFEELQVALNLLEAAAKCISERQLSSKKRSGGAISSQAQARLKNTTLYDKASVYIQLAQVLAQMNKLPEATKTIQDAMSLFQGSTQEVRVLVANSELAVRRGDYKTAVDILSNVPSYSPAFAKAQLVKADIFLTHHNDKVQYAKCFQELVQINPCASSNSSLAEAYLRIQMLDEALDALHAATAYSPNDPTLASKIGKVLVAKHDYEKAIEYYENALASNKDNLALRKDLAELYAQTKTYDEALRVTQDISSHQTDRAEELVDDTNGFSQEDLINLEYIADLQMVLSRVQLDTQDLEGSISTMQKALSLQKILLERKKSEQLDVQNKQRKAISDTCYLISKTYLKKGTNAEVDIILEFCTQALDFDGGHEPSLLLLAQVHKQLNQFDECQSNLMTLLRLNPSNEEAALMLADLMLHKEQEEAAIQHFHQLLEVKPDNFAALCRFIVMLRRVGKLNEVPKYIAKAEVSLEKNTAGEVAGLHVCKGLFARYKNKISEAIEEFNYARRDADWGQVALMNMIQICLNPDNENLWDNLKTNSTNEEANSNSSTKEQNENLRTANTLLSELQNLNGSFSLFTTLENSSMTKKLLVRILEAYALLTAKTKSTSEKAIQIFMEILDSIDRDYVPALLGLATAYMLTKQQPKARNQLKRIAKMTYNQQFADDFERSYLLLAELYIQRSKYDLAQELCKKALMHNKSCGKAWEMLGHIMEKEQSYIDAADCYDEAWACEGEASATTGFKLAFNYLKAKKYVASVDICHKVLNLYPDYPKIRKEILEKAYAGFRP
ncbi:hypothetical protein ABG067_001192 [Albugo candida]